MPNKFRTIIFIIIFFVPNILFAKTDINISQLDKNEYWTKENSPYILHDYLYIPNKIKLTVGEGVNIMSASTTPGVGSYYIYADGNIDIKGTESDRVGMYGMDLLNLSGINHISYTDFIGTGLIINRGTTTISNSRISGANIAIDSRHSVIDISDTDISNNDKGIVSNIWSPGPFLIYNNDKDSGIGGIGNALEDIDPDQNIIEIHNSIIKDNGEYSVVNKTSNLVHAEDNWWGSNTGPGTSISGPVMAEPWKVDNPDKENICCSNVIFLPGLEASRLYRDEKGWFGTSTNELWEPNRNDDVRKLYMDKDGKSLDPSIYTSDIIKSALGIQNIYNDFSDFMDSMVSLGTINKWLPFAYDWRNSVASTTLGDVNYSKESKNLIKEVEKLASSSKTGKVTILSHSNGGLLAKYLGRELENEGKINLLDKVIFVAVPQLGTPQAIAGILHGDNQSILGGVVLSSKVARTLGINMPGAYGLLPSLEYFKRLADPFLTFFDIPPISYNSINKFLVGKIDIREQPKESDLKTPAVLSQNILNDTDSIHQYIDNWEFPSNIKVVSIAGWGMPTTRTIDYSGDSVNIKKDLDGDGTVVSESANSYDGYKTYLNQRLIADNKLGNILHANILESPIIKFFLEKILKLKSEEKIEDVPLPQYMSDKKPDVNDYASDSWLTVSAHSPIDIDIYDKSGGHIGLIPLPNHPDSDLMWLDNTIGGQYDAIGDEKYITIPGDRDYSVQLSGNGVGTFTYKVEKFKGADMIEVASTTYENLPVTPFLKASTTVNSLKIDAPLLLDFDGNGTTDVEFHADDIASKSLYIESIKSVIKSLKLKSSVERDLLKRIDNAYKKLGKRGDGKEDGFIKKMKKLSSKLEDSHWKAKEINDENREEITDFFKQTLDIDY